MVVHIYMLVLDRAKRRIGFVSGEELADRQQSMSSLAPVAPKFALEWGDAFVEDLLDQELQHVIGLGGAQAYGVALGSQHPACHVVGQRARTIAPIFSFLPSGHPPLQLGADVELADHDGAGGWGESAGLYQLVHKAADEVAEDA